MNAKQIIDSILKKVNLTANIVDDPFAAADIEVREIVDLLNDKVVTLTTENDFSQIKKECIFYVYSSWEVNTSYSVGDSVKVGDVRYYATTPGTSATEPSHTSGTVADSTASDWASGESVSMNDERLSNNKLYRATTTGTTGASAPSHTSGTASDGGVTWLFVRNVIYWEYRGTAEKYPLSEIAGDLRSFSPNTFFNITDNEEMKVMTDEQWQRRRSFDVELDSSYFMVRDEAIWLYPNYDEGAEIRFFYYSKEPITAEDGTTKEEFDTTTDETALPAQLLIWGTAYEWLAQKGFQSANNALRNYESQKSRYLAQNKANKRVRLDGRYSMQDSNIEEGSWDI